MISIVIDIPRGNINIKSESSPPTITLATDARYDCTNRKIIMKNAISILNMDAMTTTDAGTRMLPIRNTIKLCVTRSFFLSSPIMYADLISLKNSVNISDRF